MLHRSSDAQSFRHADPQDDSVTRLIASLREGVEALKDPLIEANVQDYFERHPNYSRDLIHVAAVAVGFKSARNRDATESAPFETTRQ